jgi:hypothetical protein
MQARFRLVEIASWPSARAAVERTSDAHTRRVNLNGKLVVPGAMDSNLHASKAAIYEFDHPCGSSKLDPADSGWMLHRFEPLFHTFRSVGTAQCRLNGNSVSGDN